MGRFFAPLADAAIHAVVEDLNDVGDAGSGAMRALRWPRLRSIGTSCCPARISLTATLRVKLRVEGDPDRAHTPITNLGLGGISSIATHLLYGNT